MTDFNDTGAYYEEDSRLQDKKTDIKRKKLKVIIIIVSAFLAVAIFTVLFVFRIFTMIKNDTSYKAAVSYIESNPEIINLVGDIKGYGYIPVGGFEYSGGYGEAGYTIKVVGNKNIAYVHIQLEKEPSKDWETISFDYEK